MRETEILLRRELSNNESDAYYNCRCNTYTNPSVLSITRLLAIN